MVLAGRLGVIEREIHGRHISHRDRQDTPMHEKGLAASESNSSANRLSSSEQVVRFLLGEIYEY